MTAPSAADDAVTIVCASPTVTMGRHDWQDCVGTMCPRHAASMAAVALSTLATLPQVAISQLPTRGRCASPLSLYGRRHEHNCSAAAADRSPLHPAKFSGDACTRHAQCRRRLAVRARASTRRCMQQHFAQHQDPTCRNALTCSTCCATQHASLWVLCCPQELRLNCVTFLTGSKPLHVSGGQRQDWDFATILAQCTSHSHAEQLVLHH